MNVELRVPSEHRAHLQAMERDCLVLLGAWLMWNFTPVLPATLEAHGRNLISQNSPVIPLSVWGLSRAPLWLQESSSLVYLKAGGLEPAFSFQLSKNWL